MEVNIMRVEDIERIENVLNSDMSLLRKSNFLFEICSRPIFINSLYYIDKYDDNLIRRINKIVISFEKYKKGNRYYDSNSFCKCSLTELTSRLLSINNVYELIKSNEHDYKIASRLVYYYGDSNTFKKEYEKIIENLDRPNIQIARESLNNFELIYNLFIQYEKDNVIKNNYKIEVMNIDDFEKIENEMKNTSTYSRKGKIIFDFCCNPKFINTLYFYDKYDQDVQKRIDNIKKQFEKYRNYYKYNNDKAMSRYSLEEMACRLKKINIIYNSIKSNKSDYIIAEQFILLFKNVDKFKGTYSHMLKHINHPNIQIAREALDNFDIIYNKMLELEKSGVIDNVMYYVKTMGYHQNYEYAKFIVERYIESENSYKGYEFLQEFGIDKETFIFCIKTIEELDPELYKKFAKKRTYNRKVACFKNAMTIKDIAKGIETGYLSDGTKFDMLEFIKRVPFKREPDLIEALSSFGRSGVLGECRVLIDYIYRNNLNKINSLSFISKEDTINTRSYINGTEITKEMNKIVFDYLESNNIPTVNRAYNVVLRKLLSGEITEEMVEKQKKEHDLNEKSPVMLIPKTYKKVL